MRHYSVLDLSPVPEGLTTTEALANTLELAPHAESLGYYSVLACRTSQHARYRQCCDGGCDRTGGRAHENVPQGQFDCNVFPQHLPL